MKTAVTISLAQIPVERGDVERNLTQHLQMIEHSAKHQADLVVFPELSLIGYELDLAQELAITPESDLVTVLSQSAKKNQIAVIAGCTLKSEANVKPTIAAVICFPDGSTEFYSKQYLHQGEEQFCSNGTKDYVLELKGNKIALAVCADFVSPEHSQRAAELGADVYIASALISENGFSTDAKILSGIASNCSFPVLLSNHISTTGGWAAFGNNSVWNQFGELVLSSDSKAPCLVVCKIADGQIEAHTVHF